MVPGQAARLERHEDKGLGPYKLDRSRLSSNTRPLHEQAFTSSWCRLAGAVGLAPRCANTRLVALARKVRLHRYTRPLLYLQIVTFVLYEA